MTDTVLFSANRGYALTSSREGLIRHFLSAGWTVVLATAEDAESRWLVELGARLEPVDFSRGGLAVAADWRAYRRLCKIFRHWRPALAHNFHAKPVIAGTLAARKVMGDSVRVVNTITGLGHAFVAGGLSARLAGLGYRLALPKADLTVFQNRDDRTLFLERGWVPEPRARLIAGSGVDLERFSHFERNKKESDTLVVVMLGRLLKQKGIPEFVEVARRIRIRVPGTRFLLAGEEDPGHPDAVSVEWLRAQSAVEYLGRLSDVTPVFAEADLLLFPSYYREGVPRVVMEAAATGLPTVALDVPGVREAVRDGETGFLVPDRDVDTLTARVAELLENCERRLAMGRSAHRLAEEAFDIRTIQARQLNLYRELGIEIA